MTNTPRGDGPEPTQPLGPSYPGYPDPAYAGQSPYGPTYQAPQVPDPTRQLPPYSPYGYDPYATGQYGTGQYGPPYPPASRRKVHRRPSRRGGCGWWPRSRCFWSSVW